MNEYLPLVIGLGSPILVALGGLLSWFVKSKKEDLQAIEERALNKRITIYNEILHPFIVLFSANASETTKSSAVESIGSVSYRTAAFNLITFGSDEMVISYNDLMQSFYKNEGEKDPKALMKKFARFILSIRKDVYNKNTKLKEWDMLKFMITDIEKVMK